MPHSDEIKKMTLDPAIRRLADLLDDMERRCCPDDLSNADAKKHAPGSLASSLTAKD